jgi:hypothetical protein
VCDRTSAKLSSNLHNGKTREYPHEGARGIAMSAAMQEHKQLDKQLNHDLIDNWLSK